MEMAKRCLQTLEILALVMAAAAAAAVAVVLVVAPLGLNKCRRRYCL